MTAPADISFSTISVWPFPAATSRGDERGSTFHGERNRKQLKSREWTISFTFVFWVTIKRLKQTTEWVICCQVFIMKKECELVNSHIMGSGQRDYHLHNLLEFCILLTFTSQDYWQCRVMIDSWEWHKLIYYSCKELRKLSTGTGHNKTHNGVTHTNTYCRGEIHIGSLLQQNVNY